jgi:hypothetical protein
LNERLIDLVIELKAGGLFDHGDFVQFSGHYKKMGYG